MFINGYVNNKCLHHAAIFMSLLQILGEYDMQHQVRYYCKAWIFLDGYFISALWEFAARLSKLYFNNTSPFVCDASFILADSTLYKMMEKKKKILPTNYSAIILLNTTKYATGKS